MPSVNCSFLCQSSVKITQAADIQDVLVWFGMHLFTFFFDNIYTL